MFAAYNPNQSYPGRSWRDKTPVGIIDGPNKYRHAGNDPLNFRDPTGLSQAGNPLNNLAGGFGSNVVSTVSSTFTDFGGIINPSSFNVPSTQFVGPTLANQILGTGIGSSTFSPISTFTPVSTSTFNTGFSTPSFNDSIFNAPLTASVINSASTFTGSANNPPTPTFTRADQFNSYLQRLEREQPSALLSAIIDTELRGIAQAQVRHGNTFGAEATQIADIGTSVTPIVSDVRDFTEVITGRDAITGQPLSGFQRGVTAIAAALPIVPAKPLRELFSGPVARTKPGKTFIPSNHLQGVAGETQLMQSLQKSPNHVILSTNRTVTDNGADVITFNKQTGRVHFFDNKSTVGNRPGVDGTRSPAKVNQSRTFTDTRRFNRVLQDARDAIDQSNLSFADKNRALQSLQDETFIKVTRGSGNAKNSAINIGP